MASYRVRRADALIDIGKRLRITGLIFSYWRLRILANCSRRDAPAADNGLATRRADQIASLKPFATRNTTFFDALLALIRISSPVAGLRPIARRTCRSNSYLQDAKVGNADFATLLQHATDVGHEAGEHLDRLLLG